MKNRISVRMLLQAKFVSLAAERAIAAYLKSGGTTDDVIILIAVTDGKGVTGAADAVADLTDYPREEILFSRDGDKPVSYSLEETMTLRAMLADAGVALGEGEMIVSENDDPYELDMELSPFYSKECFLFKIVPKPSSTAPSQEG